MVLIGRLAGALTATWLESLELANSQKWPIVSIKNDWKEVFD